MLFDISRTSCLNIGNDYIAFMGGFDLSGPPGFVIKVWKESNQSANMNGLAVYSQEV